MKNDDIVERLRALSRCEHSDLSIGDEAAAEIDRLRGEACSCPSGDGSLRWPCKAHPPESIAPAEAKAPAPAMPNGVEGLVALWRQQEDNGEERTEFDKGYEQASGECAEALEAALRAADNRDAAGVSDDDFVHPEYIRGFNDGAKATPAAVPAGEAVAWRHPDEVPEVVPGGNAYFWVAVRRKHDGRVYSFPAQYLNAMLLCNEWSDDTERSGNRYRHGPTDEDEGSFPATGWHVEKEHGEYDGVYLPLLGDADELVAWREVANYPDTTPPAPVQAAPQPADGEAVARRPQFIVDRMVSAFLSWRLPQDFRPDNGVAFASPGNPSFWPSGTNLFNADQAKAMVEHMLGPAIARDRYTTEEEGDAFTDGYFTGADEALATPPAAQVQAAPQEGEAWSGWATQSPGRLPRLWGAREIAELNYYPEDGQRLLFLSEAARPSACELGAVRELVADWRESASNAKRHSNTDYENGYAAAESNCANRLEAALQHRGDSRGGEG